MSIFLKGISQVYFAENETSGAIILLAMFFHSRIVAMMSFLGCVLGTVTGVMMGTSAGPLLAGLWGTLLVPVFRQGVSGAPQ